MDTRDRLIRMSERAQGWLISGTIIGSALAFGGATWWARPALGALILTLVVVAMIGAWARGTWVVLRSPLGPLALLALALAVFQLMPLPADLAGRISPRSREAHALGVMLDLVRQDDPGIALPEFGGARTPTSLDRSATLRWLIGALGCFALFRVTSHFCDRRGHLMLVWGSLVLVLFVGTLLGGVQRLGGTTGLYGFIDLGSGPMWGPSMDDLASSPNATALRLLVDSDGIETSWTTALPERPEPVAGWIGGVGTYLAFGALALPLAWALALHGISPRGSRESLAERMSSQGQGGLPLAVLGFTLTSAVMIGLMAGRVLAIPIALGVTLTCVGTWGSGLRWWAGVGLALLVLVSLVGGVVWGEALGPPAETTSLVASGGWDAMRSLWLEAVRIGRDFPVVGAGLGTFPTIHAYYKVTDLNPTTAHSTLLQWWAETGLGGMALVALAALWCLLRLPKALRRVGATERILACGLLGSVVGFVTFSMIHWSMEVRAVALAVSALAGALERWLSGGTDLFVEGGIA